LECVYAASLDSHLSVQGSVPLTCHFAGKLDGFQHPFCRKKLEGNPEDEFSEGFSGLIKPKTAQRG